MAMNHELVQEVTVAEVWERMKKGESLRLVDVRERDEVEELAIPGIRHIALRDLPDRYEEIDPNVETILVCRSGRRSNIACKFLMFLGYQNVKNMSGGMNHWAGDVRLIG
jgi:rhodanese-related sulfurtransferase